MLQSLAVAAFLIFSSSASAATAIVYTGHLDFAGDEEYIRIGDLNEPGRYTVTFNASKKLTLDLFGL